MMSIDIKTAFAVAGLVSLLAALTTSVLRKLHDPSRPAMVRLALALASGGCGLLLAAHHETTPWNLSGVAMVLGAMLIVFGYQSTRLLYGESPQTPAAIGGLGLLALMIAVAPDGRFALTLHYGFQALFALAAVVTVARADDPDAPRGRIALAVSFGVLALGATVRLVRTLLFDQAGSIESLHRKLWAEQGWAPVLTIMLPMIVMVLVIGIVLSRQLQALRLMTSTDELTGTASRRHLFAQGERWISERTAAGPGTVALMMIDVDNFKAINDRYGHVTGDRVLRHVAQVLGRTLSPDAVLARYGGEEFCVLAPIADARQAATIAEALRRAAEITPYLGEDGTILVTVSIGLALHHEGATLAEMLRLADRRVYVAKAEGRNRISDEQERLELAVV